MPRRDYPDEISLKVENRVKRGDSDAFNTTDQQKAAKHLKEHWPIQFNDLADKTGEYTDGMYRRVIKEYFGPADADLTFEELWDEYGTLDQYYKRRDESEESSEAFERGLERGIDIGFEKGFEQARKQYADDE